MAEATSQSNPPVLAEELNSIAARAQTYTGASGAAIALSEGDVSEAVCRACSGPSAPDAGAHIRLEGTFTGMAVQSGQALRCDDSETDKRVDAAACRALGTRSIVVVPIRDADTEAVAGVLAVFAGTKNAFNDLHVAVLRTMAREVAVAVQKARKAGIPLSTLSSTPIAQPAARPVSDPGFTPPPMPRPAPVAMPPASASAAAAKTAPEPAATVLTPTPMPAPRPVAAPPPVPKVEAPAPISEETFQPVVAPITPRRTSPPAPPAPEWKPAPPPPPRKTEAAAAARAETRSASASTANFGTFDDVGQDKKPGGGGMGIWIGVAAAVVLAIGGYFAYNQFSGKPAAPSVQTAQPSAPSNTSSAPPLGQSTTTGTTSTPPPTQSSNQPAAQSTSAPAAAKGAASQSQPTPQQKPAAQQQPPPQQTSTQQTSTQQNQAKPSPQAVERAAVTPSSSPRQDAPPAPVAGPSPQIAVPISNSSPTLAVQAPKISQATGATLVTQVAPRYPDMARAMRAEGAVQVEATVGTDGTVRSVRAVSGHSMLREAATSAVKQWRYKPATLNGQPVESTVQITVKFTAPR